MINIKWVLIIMLTVSAGNVFGKASKAEKEFYKKSKSLIKEPFKIRDPFKKLIKQSRRGKKIRAKAKTFFSNMKTIDNVPLDKIIIVGVLLGENRRAIAKIGSLDEEGRVIKGSDEDSDSFILREGMTLGENNAEIKAILPGGIVLVEKIRNIYDEDEYLETIIPLSDD